LVMVVQLTGILRRYAVTCTASTVFNKPSTTPSHLTALIMGFLMGVNICPPFLLSLSYVVSLHDILDSMLYFTIFFFISSLYFLPMVFVGMLARINEIQRIARLSGIITAGLFIAYGIYSITGQISTGR
ncbi:MAG: sulfite exporter TauE/SafE family protein, partial [Candidatus Omnitrophota bacterium]